MYSVLASAFSEVFSQRVTLLQWRMSQRISSVYLCKCKQQEVKFCRSYSVHIYPVRTECFTDTNTTFSENCLFTTLYEQQIIHCQVSEEQIQIHLFTEKVNLYRTTMENGFSCIPVPV